MGRVVIPPEKQCAKIKADGIKCTNAKYQGYEFCYQHCDAGLKAEVVRQKDGRLYHLTCNNCYLKDECPEFKQDEKCTYTTGVRAYDISNMQAYNRLLQKLIQMETESFIRVWLREKETGEGGEDVSKRFKRLLDAMNEFKKNVDAEKVKKPQSLADLIKE